MSYRSFLIYPTGSIAENDGDDRIIHVRDQTLYDTLLTAGYPLHRNDIVAQFDSTIDLRIEEDGSVRAYTSGPEPREHHMGAAGKLFLAWLRDADQDQRVTGSQLRRGIDPAKSDEGAAHD